MAVLIQGYAPLDLPHQGLAQPIIDRCGDPATLAKPHDSPVEIIHLAFTPARMKVNMERWHLFSPAFTCHTRNEWLGDPRG